MSNEERYRKALERILQIQEIIDLDPVPMIHMMVAEAEKALGLEKTPAPVLPERDVEFAEWEKYVPKLRRVVKPVLGKA